jgi:hypothetical protein
MKKIHFFKFVLTAVLMAAASHAVATLTGPTNIVLPEDGVERDFTFTFTNTGTEIFFVGPTFAEVEGMAIFESGDLSDIPNAFFEDKCSTLDLPAGASCTVLLHVTPPDGIGETHADFGVLPYFVQVNLDNLHELDGTITITDPGVSINVPEPATCALLGLGLAGIGLARGSRLRKERLLGAVRHPGVPAQRLVR